MKKILVLGLMTTFALAFVSCNNFGVNPQKIFDKIGLNGNKIPSSFASQFKEMRAHKAKGSLTIIMPNNEVKKGVSALEYTESNYSKMLEPDIKGIKELKTNEETQPIIDAGLDMFQYADEIYKNDFPQIAKMIDDGKPDEEIDAAIEELDATKGVELDKKYNKTMDLLLPYAEKNGVKYKIHKSPF